MLCAFAQSVQTIVTTPILILKNFVITDRTRVNSLRILKPLWARSHSGAARIYLGAVNVTTSNSSSTFSCTPNRR